MKFCQNCGTKLGQPGCFCREPKLVTTFEWNPSYIPETLEEINDMLDIAKAKVECFEKIKAIKERRK